MHNLCIRFTFEELEHGSGLSNTQYAKEMKKVLFSVMHHLMPRRQIFSMHSNCNAY